jgi:Cu(I)/Ag(I) efflux system membrane fusion protein
VAAPSEGWVEKLFVQGAGAFVTKGQPLAEIFSTAAQAELLSDLWSTTKGGVLGEERVRIRLHRWGLDENQIESLIRAPERLSPVLTLFSAASGVVAENTVVVGQRLTEGESMFLIEDLTTVWAETDVFEGDAPYLKPGTSATVTVPSLPGRSFASSVKVVTPFLDPQTRTARARLEIPNPDLVLGPEMYGVAEIELDLGTRLLVPDSALMRNGSRDYVFRLGPGGELEPVDVKLGVHGEAAYEVLAGLAAGDKVVTSGNFLVDSESSLQAGLAAAKEQ